MLRECQTRGGRKGGLPACELNGFVPNTGFNCATCEGKTTGDERVLENVKHLRAHIAMDEQPSTTLSQGLVLCGQQSMSSMAAISVVSVDDFTAPTPPAAGSTATDSAIRKASRMRPNSIAPQNSRVVALAVK